MKRKVVVLGAGKIGRMVVHFLHTCGDYEVTVMDAHLGSVEALAKEYPGLHAAHGAFDHAADLERVLTGQWAVLSCAPYYCNGLIAERAKALGVHYLDLTEDVAVTKKVMQLAEGANTAFIPQCGLAPGFISIAAYHLARDMSEIRDLRLRVGALPRYPNNALKYNLTWSTEGLINEYIHPCEAVVDGSFCTVPALENLESIVVDGTPYEAFNTSGGLGTLAETLKGRVRNLNYKTIRYPGHNAIMKVLMHDLRFREHAEELRKVFDRAVPYTPQDQVVIYVSASGMVDGQLVERMLTRCVKHAEFDGKWWTGIQVTTAAGICAVLDMLAAGQLPQRGFVRNEAVSLDAFLQNRFGKHYA